MRKILIIIAVILLPVLILAFTHGDDYVVGIISVDRIEIKNPYHANGGFEDSTVVISLTQNNWAQLTNDYGTLISVDESNGFTSNNDTLIFTNAGDYTGIFDVTFDGGNVNTYEFRVLDVTGSPTQVGYKKAETAGGSGKQGSITLITYFDAIAGSKYIVQIRNISSNLSATIINGSFSIEYLHN